MFKNYMKIAIRSIARTKAFSLINIIGLAIGMTGTLLILMYIANELSYENFHENRDQIFRVSVEFGDKNNRMRFAGAMPALGRASVEEFPEVENAVRFERGEHSVLEYNEKKFHEQNLFFADPSIFQVFSFKMVKGSQETALDDPFSMVITEEKAQKLFGSDDPLGKMVIYNAKHPVRITGIMKNIPANTI